MSEVKVNKISPRSGTGVTLGDNGDTFTVPSGGTIAIAAGATINNQGTAVNFGATGSASWVTTVKTSSPFTAVAGEGYFVNTTGGAITVNLPAGTAGAVIAIKDYANTFDSNACILVPNGSDKIGGATGNSNLTAEGLAVTLVFVDATKGWLVTDSGLQSEAPTAQFVTATGGNTTLTVCSHKIHIFTGPGALCVSCAGNPAGSNTVEYLVIAGGGGSGGYGSSGSSYQGGGGGGGGGWRSFTALPAASPSNAPAALPVSVQSYTVTVGGGGAGDPSNSSGGSRGDPSTFSSITSTGGGGGGSKNSSPSGVTGANKTGGSGGGGAGRESGQSTDEGGTGNTPVVSPAQGQDGGDGARRTAAPASQSGSGGGGGASQAAGNQPQQGDDGGPAGNGQYIPSSFFGPTAPSYGQSPSPLAPNGRYFSGGGGGGSANTPGSQGPAGAGGGGIGGNASSCNAVGVINTGGGGGGPSSQSSKAGGSGIVAIRYKFQ